MTVLLVGFVPVAWVFSQSTDSLAWMGLPESALRLGRGGVRRTFSFAWASPPADQIPCRLQRLGDHLHARDAADDHGVAPLLGTAEHVPATQKKFFVAHWLDSNEIASQECPVRGARLV